MDPWGVASHGVLDALAALPLRPACGRPRGHGSSGPMPRRAGTTAGIPADRPDDELHRDQAGADADVVIAGHTHRPTDRVVGGIRPSTTAPWGTR